MNVTLLTIYKFAVTRLGCLVSIAFTRVQSLGFFHELQKFVLVFSCLFLSFSFFGCVVCV